MSVHLIIDGNAVYEVDEDCMKRKYGRMEFWGGYQRQTEDGKTITCEENRKQPEDE